jgi:hypothetical protein
MINLDVPEHEKTDDWYLKVGRYLTTFYNLPIFPYPNKETALTPVDEMNRCFLYYYGQQGAARNFPVIQDTILMELQSRNNQIFQLVNSLHGKMSEFMAKFNISTELLSADAKTRRDIFKQMLIFTVDNKDFLEKIKELGVTFNPLPENIVLSSREDVEEYMDVSYREEGAEVAENLAKAIIKINDYATLKTQQFLDVVISGLTGCDRYIENGILKEKICAPQSLILDFRSKSNNAYNDDAWFRGFWENLIAPDAILERYGDNLSEEAIKEIKSLSTQQTTSQYYATFTQVYPQSPTTYYNWWQGNGSYLTGLSVAKIYFKARVDYRYKKKKTRSGSIIVKENDYKDGKPVIENMNRKGIVTNYRWHQATIIGNKWVVNAGLVPNAIYEQLKISEQECPATVFIDNYMGGYYRSRVSRMTDLQDDYNLATIKRKAAMINDMGINYIITNAGEDSNTSVKKIFQDFNSQHMTMLKKDLDSNPDLVQMRFAEMVDFTKSLTVVGVYENIMASLEREMSKMMHLPDVSQGLQQSVIGKGVQQATTNLAAVGVAPLFNGFINYIQRGLQLSANMQKLAFCADDVDEDYPRMILGDRGYEWLKSAVMESFEHLGIYINPYDQIDEAKSQDLNMMVQAAFQNGLLDFNDAIKLKTMTSYRHALIYLNRITKQRKMESQKAAEQQRMDSMAMAQGNIEAGMEAKKIPAQAIVQAKTIQAQATSQDNERTNATKKEMNDLQQQVKLLTKQMEQVTKKESTI